MLKGIPGVTNTDVHLVPVIRNTPREPELVSQLEARLRRPTLRRRTRSSCATMGPTSGATTCLTRSATPRSTTSCSRPRSHGATAIRRIDDDRWRRTASPDLSHLTKIDVVDVAAAVEADKLTDADVFKRTYLGHGTQSSVFVFQGHPGPFRTHVHETHDEIGYVLEGTGSVTVGGVTRPVKRGDVWVIPANTPHGGEFEDAPQVLFISSPIDDPDNQDRVWLD